MDWSRFPIPALQLQARFDAICARCLHRLKLMKKTLKSQASRFALPPPYR